MKTGKSHSFTNKRGASLEPKARKPLLEVYYQDPNVKSICLAAEDIPLDPENEQKFQKSHPEFKELIEADKILLSDPIFNELSPAASYSKSKNCIVCGEKFGLLQKRRNCGFCGESVCRDHSQKKRANPKNSAEFVRICENCERKYLEKMIYDEFVVKKNRRNKAIFDLERELARLKEDLRAKQRDVLALANQGFPKKEEAERLHRERLSRLDEKLRAVKKRIEEVEEGNRELSLAFEKVNSSIKEEDLKAREFDGHQNQLKKELEEKTAEMKRVEAQIKELESSLQGLEAQLSKEKFKMQEADAQEVWREQNEMTNSYIKSIMSQAQSSLMISNPSLQLADKDYVFRKEKACFCKIF